MAIAFKAAGDEMAHDAQVLLEDDAGADQLGPIATAARRFTITEYPLNHLNHDESG